MPSLAKLQEHLGVYFADPRLLQSVLIHRSFLHERPDQASGLIDNERLEFLGDAILGAVVADYLYKKFPYKTEGYLTDIRSKMVSRSQLNVIAQKMGITELISFNDADMLLNKKSLSGNALEALVGAIFIDKGFVRARNFILKKIVKPFLDIEEIAITEFNYKSKLLEWSQKNGRSLYYTVKHHSRSRHRTLYRVAAVIDGKEYGTGEDTNKKNAEKLAAKSTFEVLNLSVTEFM